MLDKADEVDLSAWELDNEFEEMYIDAHYDYSIFYSPEAPIFY
jgi:hypothetical protein